MFQLARTMRISDLQSKCNEREKEQSPKPWRGCPASEVLCKGVGRPLFAWYWQHLPGKRETWHPESPWADEVKSHNCLKTVSAVGRISTFPTGDGVIWIKVFNNQAPEKPKRKFDFVLDLVGMELFFFIEALVVLRFGSVTKTALTHRCFGHCWAVLAQY